MTFLHIMHHRDALILSQMTTERVCRQSKSNEQFLLFPELSKDLCWRHVKIWISLHFVVIHEIPVEILPLCRSNETRLFWALFFLLLFWLRLRFWLRLQLSPMWFIYVIFLYYSLKSNIPLLNKMFVKHECPHYDHFFEKLTLMFDLDHDRWPWLWY